jgi:hypothetical protein
MSNSAKFIVQGDVTWTRGVYRAGINSMDGTKSSQWLSTGSFTIGPVADAKIAPYFSAPSFQGHPTWNILEGAKGITGNPDGRLIQAGPGEPINGFEILVGTNGATKSWNLHQE